MLAQQVDMHIIAHIHSSFSQKFGIPRQSGLSDALKATIVFEEPYRNMDALRGLQAYSHIWVLWQFSKVRPGEWSPTVRPPRLGGNRRVGVFATRSPYRPNAIGLSCVKLEGVCMDDRWGPVLQIAGADMLDGTPVLDIKPYLPYTDAHPDARSGFSVDFETVKLRVCFPDLLLQRLPARDRQAVCDLLAQDPRPGYQSETDRCYGMQYDGYDIRFVVDAHVVHVLDVVKLDET